MEFEIGEIRKMTKLMAPSADFESPFNFYYDETNNIKKFYVRENDFNYTFTANFVLGGLVHVGEEPNVQPLIDSLKLQKTATEVKFKHIANGALINCLKSTKLNLFLDFIVKSNLHVHYSSLNILYWAIVDIVDSAIANSPTAIELGISYSNRLKNDLYKLSRLEIDSVIELFYKFEYPNIKIGQVIPFIDSLTRLFEKYIDNEEFHFGLESLRQILKEAKKNDSLPFLVAEEDFILLKDLSHFYLRPIYLFKNSNHIFDNEDFIEEIISEYKILDREEEIKNYSFVESKSSLLIQLSDVFVGLMGKLSNYLNTSTIEHICKDFDHLNALQKENINLLFDLIDKSHNKNIGFIHSTDSFEEMNKINTIRQKIKQ